MYREVHPFFCGLWGLGCIWHKCFRRIGVKMKYFVFIFIFLISSSSAIQLATACHVELSPIYRYSEKDKSKYANIFPELVAGNIDNFSGEKNTNCELLSAASIEVKFKDSVRISEADVGVFLFPIAGKVDSFFPRYAMKPLYYKEQKKFFVNFLITRKKIRQKFILVPVMPNAITGKPSVVYEYIDDGEKLTIKQ